MAGNLNSILEQTQRHVSIAANLEHLQIEFEELLQALDQIDNLPQIHFCAVQFYLEEVDLEQLQEDILEILCLPYLIEREVETHPLQSLEASD